jgi:hypothetical protein
MGHESGAWEAFCRDIPKEDHDDVLTILSEAVAGYDHHKEVHILNRWQSDVINATADGTFQWKDVEYYFHLENGNYRGTVLLGWEDAGNSYKEPEPVVYALQPRADLVDAAILAGKGPFLVWKWEALAGRSDLATIPMSYAYDNFFQPGIKVNDYWRKKAAEHKFEIVTKETADETRARLMKADQNDNPALYTRRTSGHAIPEAGVSP